MTNKRTNRLAKKDGPVQNVGEIIALEKREEKKLTLTDKFADKITSFSGSMTYVTLHVVWFAVWIVINLGLFHVLKPFDPFPFSLLTLIVSLEAIFLSSFVLISQNKQALSAEKRARIDLQVNLIAERENTKLIKMVEDIHHHLRIRKKIDAQVRELEKTTDISKLATKLDKEEKKSHAKT
jgi:uncharacterized membrane protein